LQPHIVQVGKRICCTETSRAIAKAGFLVMQPHLVQVGPGVSCSGKPHNATGQASFRLAQTLDGCGASPPEISLTRSPMPMAPSVASRKLSRMSKKPACTCGTQHHTSPSFPTCKAQVMGCASQALRDLSLVFTLQHKECKSSLQPTANTPQANPD
jgi:hypothetical protein